MFSLSICIPSYNRPKELKRLLDSIKLDHYLFDYEIIVADDCSPSQEEITVIVESQSKRIKYIPSNANIGFDENAILLAKASTKDYLLYVADDDVVNSEYFKNLFEFLEINKPAILVSSYMFINDKNIIRKKPYNWNNKLYKSSHYTKAIYSLIFLSGLIISREELLNLLPLDVKGLIYSQVYWGLLIADRKGLEYFTNPLITVVGDGANGWGTNSGEPKNILLSDRNLLFSPISYHLSLFRVIRLLQNRISKRFIDNFSISYSFRSYQLFHRAFLIGGRKATIIFFKKLYLARKEIKFNFFIVLVIFLLVLMNGSVLNHLFIKLTGYTPANLLKRIRGGV